jgi:NadR type nicotinamide-nucleotide adenylyltransferase
MLCHHVTQAIPGEVRAAWLRELHPDCEVHLVPDELEDDSQQWADFTRAYLGFAPDVVFSSEDYGPRFAALLGARHVMVDRPRATVPISATSVRADPLAHLAMLAPCVRAWFVRRVVVIGAESTGKTTLTRALAAHHATACVLEYGREHWEQKVAGLPMPGAPGADPEAPLPAWSDDEFVHIAAEQQRREELAARAADRVLFCDTNAFATGTWYERYRGGRDPRVDAIGARDRVDLYLLTAPDVPFVQDGFRDGEHLRGWMHQRFREQLDAAAAAGGAPYVVLDGPHPGRWPRALAAVDELLARRPG